MTVVFGIIVLGIVVLVHEFGHFIVARGFGVRVEKFSIGFGPALVARRIGETVYAISAVPLGGYVKMAGEQLDEEGKTGAPDEFMSQHWAKRLGIVVAGPLANLALAVVANCFVGIVGYQVSTPPAVVDQAAEAAAVAGFLPGDQITAVGPRAVDTWHGLMVALDEAPGDKPIAITVRRPAGDVSIVVPARDLDAVVAALTPRAESIVGDVAPGMPADQAGLKAGDRIVAVDGVPVSTWEEMRILINGRPDEAVRLEFERDGRHLTTTARPLAQMDEETGERYGVIGITLPAVTVTLPLREAVSTGLLQTMGMVRATYRGFVDLVSAPQRAVRQVAGPITIAQIAGDSIVGAPGTLLIRVAFISVALMALNLLPIPILDGGHAFLFLVEGLSGRRVSERSQLAFQKVGLVVIGSLIIFSLVNDSLRLVERVRARHELNQQAPADRSP